MLAYHVVTLGSGTSSITGLYYTALPEGIDILLATGPGAVRDREAHVRLYPNPATQGWVALVGLEEGAQEWTFMDAAGRVVDKRRIVAADGQARIPLAQVPAGSYLLVPATGVSPLRLVVH